MTRHANEWSGSNQQTFSRFYDTYAPKLWGLILRAKLPTSRSERILSSTFKKAWPQLSQQTSTSASTFTWLLTLAYGEGLPPIQPAELMKNDNRSSQPVYVLLAGCCPDDQALLAQSLKTSMPQIEIGFIPTVNQTLQHLQNTSLESRKFPRLLLLNVERADGQSNWPILQQIKVSYRQLPIVLISTDQQGELALQAYDLGVNSFLVKSLDLDEWQKKLDALADYWLSIVTLPNQQKS
ncbi:response regulator [Spirosoma sp. KCTC 42546]|uniref:response regulator n=1 Tax=Spirosoma sp. KCTC 42546 TaxID=2520506 RepID=UPI00115B9870|nr:response regulator [Spirosoma sp. KCTC 42546]QDK80811.1 response regulator [Spirosoma sp. KCTC 42546]